MVAFSKIANSDQFVQRLNGLEQGIASNKLVDTTLELYTKYTACPWLSYLMKPLYSLVGWEYSATFRVKNVATSLLRLCHANQEYMTADIKQKVVGIIDTLDAKLNAKTKEKYSKDINEAKVVLEYLGKPQP